jgi:hypothetical protein
VPAAFAGIRQPTPQLLPRTRHAPARPAHAHFAERHRELHTLLERFADRLAPADRRALHDELVERRRLLDRHTDPTASRPQAHAHLWREALRHPWRLTDASYRQALLSGEPSAALERRAA